MSRCEAQLNANQFAFDMLIFMFLKMVVLKYHILNAKMCMIFLNAYSKIFDRVNNVKVFEKFEKQDAPGNLFSISIV